LRLITHFKFIGDVAKMFELEVATRVLMHWRRKRHALFGLSNGHREFIETDAYIGTHVLCFAAALKNWRGLRKEKSGY